MKMTLSPGPLNSNKSVKPINLKPKPCRPANPAAWTDRETIVGNIKGIPARLDVSAVSPRHEVDAGRIVILINHEVIGRSFKCAQSFPVAEEALNHHRAAAGEITTAR